MVSTPPTDDLPSLDVVLTQVNAIADSLLDERNSLNTRASFVLGSASVIIGVVVGILGAVSNLRPLQKGLAHWGIAIDILLYLAVVYFAGRGYAEDTFNGLNPSRLPEYLALSEQETKWALLQALLASYRINRRALARKSGFVVVAVVALLAEVILLAVLLIVVAVLS